MKLARSIVAYLVLTSAFSLSASAVEASRFRPERAVKDADYDRLDGTGRTKMEVKVIEWEGNIEIHVYPGGSLAGLGVAIQDKNEKNPALAFGYRFTNDALTQIVRRAPMTTKISKGFRAYRDTTTGSEYDKLIITNKEIKGKGIALYTLDPPPTQLYPSGHPLSGIPVEDDSKSAKEEAKPAAVPVAKPAAPEAKPAAPVINKGPAPASATEKPAASYDEDSGMIKGGFGL